MCEGGSSRPPVVNCLPHREILNESNDIPVTEKLSTEENILRVLDIVGNEVDRDEVIRVLDVSYDVEEAVTFFLPDNTSSSPKRIKEGFSNIKDVISGYQGKFYTTIRRQSLSMLVDRQNIWGDGLGFYKTALVDLVKLECPIRVKFENEVGIDAGALTVEFFTKFFDNAKKELFETVDGKEWQHVPKRSGGNNHIYKILGVAIAHSLRNNGPFFDCLAPWAVDVLCNNNGTSGNIGVNDIPITTSTGCTVNFIKSLAECNTHNEITQLFQSTDGPAYEQIIGLSDWDPNEDITCDNKSILINMLIYEEMVIRRGKKVNAIREGLAMMEFADYLHLPVTRQIFSGIPTILSADIVSSVIDWPSPSGRKECSCVEWLGEFLKGCNNLGCFLQFCTGFRGVTQLIVQKKLIELDFLHGEKLPKASACTRTLMLPLGNTKEEFMNLMDKAISFECEGFGDY